MNIYGFFILTALLTEYVLNFIADILNLRTLSHKLPEEFEDVFNADLYMKSQTYTRTRTMFGIFESTFNLSITIAFWFLRGFNYIDLLVRNCHLPNIFTGLAYVGILILLKLIISLPFSIYSTFIIEERFGFNKTTPATFIADTLKSLLLAILLGGPLLFGVLAFFEYVGIFAWLYCWSIAAIFILFVQFIAPTWIMPLFNKFTPLESGGLRNAIIDYAKSVNFSLRDVCIMDGSKRSSKSNAFFMGFGKNKRIALFDTLIKKHTIPELVAVLAHEIGHYNKKHVLQNIAISILQTGLLFFLLSLFISQQGLFDAFFVQNVSVYTGMVLFGFLYTPLKFLLSLIVLAISRKNEYEADRFATETFKQPQIMIDALKKLSVDNLSHLTPHPFYVLINYTHPPIIARINAIGHIHD